MDHPQDGELRLEPKLCQVGKIDLVHGLRTFKVEIDNKSYTVSVEQLRKEKFRATVDGITFETETVSGVEMVTWLIHGEHETIHAHTKSLTVDKVDVSIANMPFEASVQLVGVGGYTITPEPQKISSGKVCALMPGRVTSILVMEGELVSEGSPLLILEAMKMQNEITSPISGRVKSVLVREGDTVKKDESLVILDSGTK